MGNERVEGYAEGFRIGWNQGVEKFIRNLKKEYPCVMKIKKCKKGGHVICSGCRVRFKIDNIYDTQCVESEK